MKILKEIKDFFINNAFKKWLIWNKRILKNKFNWVLIAALLILCVVDIVAGTWASVMVTMILWGYMLRIEWLRDDFEFNMKNQNK